MSIAEVLSLPDEDKLSLAELLQAEVDRAADLLTSTHVVT